MKNLSIHTTSYYGCFIIKTTHYNKIIACTTTNTEAIDYARDGKLSAIKELRNEIIRKNKLN